MPKYDLDAELGAIQFMLSVFIASHPNKVELLAVFDRLSSENQIAALAVGGSGMASGLRDSLARYRTQIEQHS